MDPRIGTNPALVFDPEINANAGAKYLAYLITALLRQHPGWPSPPSARGRSHRTAYGLDLPPPIGRRSLMTRRSWRACDVSRIKPSNFCPM